MARNLEFGKFETAEFLKTTTLNSMDQLLNKTADGIQLWLNIQPKAEFLNRRDSQPNQSARIAGHKGGQRAQI